MHIMKERQHEVHHSIFGLMKLQREISIIKQREHWNPSLDILMNKQIQQSRIIPVLIWEGSLTLLATTVKPLMTELAMSYLSLVGSVLIFCVGLNLIWGKRVRVANLLPAVVLAVIAASLPIAF